MSAACQYFGVCGGCQNQHLPYAEQLENKRKRVAYLLQPFTQATVQAFGEMEYGYRNRMDFIVATGTVGFRQTDERKLVDVAQCPISEPRVNELLTEVRSFITNNPQLQPFDRKTRAGILRYCVVRVAKDACVSFVLNEDSTKLAQAKEILEQFAQHTTAENVVIAYVPADKDESVSLECFAIKGSEYLKVEFCGKELVFHSQAFFQNNTRMAQQLVNHVLNCVRHKNSAQRALIDAYGGIGTFGIVLAEHCKSVLSIESHPLSSECCTKNITLNNIANMRALNEDASNLKKCDIPQNAIVLLDPPRSGLTEKTLRYLLEYRPQTVIYVSCNPSQLAKELVSLSKYYTVEHAAVFDLFAQTNHAEAVVVLEKLS